MTELKPVQRMIGMSERMRRNSSTNASPLISGMVWSVIIRSKESGAARNAASAPAPLFFPMTL